MSSTTALRTRLALTATVLAAVLVFLAPTGAAEAPTSCELPGPDDSGLSCPPLEEVDWQWHDTTDGTVLSNATDSMGDDGNVSIELPFKVPWYGESNSTIHVASNGFLCIDDECDGLESYDAQATPDVAQPNDLLACAWTDLNPQDGGEIRYKIVGQEPNRTLVVEFDQVPHFDFSSSATTNTFQFHVQEDGDAYCMLDTITTDDSDHEEDISIGTEGPQGNDGVRYVNDATTDFTADQVAVGFLTVPSSVQSAAASPSQADGNITLNWDEIPVAESYDVFRCEGAECDPANEDTPTLSGVVAPPIDDSDVIDSTVFCYAVQANYPNGDTSGLSSSSCAIPNGPPVAPTNFKIDAVSVSFVDDEKTANLTLSWDAPDRTGGSPLATYHVSDADNTTMVNADETSVILQRACPGEWTFDVAAENTDHDETGPSSGTVTDSCEAPDAPDAPSSLTADPGTNIGDVSLNWTKPDRSTNQAPITEFHVDRKAPDNASWTVNIETVPADESSVVDTDRPTSRVFEYRVRSHNHPHDFDPESKTVDSLARGPPTATQGTQAVQVVDENGEKDDAVNVTWNPPERTGGDPITNYNIYRCDNADSCNSENGTLISDSEKTQLLDLDDDSEIPCRTKLAYAVTAENTNGESPVETSPNVSIEDVCPDPPENLQAAPGVNQVEFTWEEPTQTGASDLISYHVATCEASTGQTCNPQDGTERTLGADTTSLTIDGLGNNATACFSVHAENGDGLSLTPTSSPVCATTYDTPSPPDFELDETGPLASTLAENDAPRQLPGAWFGLAWTADDSFFSVPPIMEFELQRKQVGSPQGWQDVDTTTQNWSIGRPPNVGVSGSGDVAGTSEPGTGEWCYRVKAINLAGASDWSPPACGDAAPEAYPSAPVDFTAEGMDASDEIRLDWKAPANSLPTDLRYRVYRTGASASGFPATCVATTTETEYVDGNRASGVPFTYFVTATRDTQSSCSSPTLSEGSKPTATQTAILLDPPKPPRNLDAAPAETRGAIELDWQPPINDAENAEVTEYHVHRSGGQQPDSQITTVPAGTTSFTDTGLEEATEFTYEVTAHNHAKDFTSNRSNSATSIANGTPTAPEQLNVQSTDVLFNATGHKVLNATLSWTEPARTGGSVLDTYEVREDRGNDSSVDARFGVAHPTTETNVTLACPDGGQTEWAFDVTANNTAYDDHSTASPSVNVTCNAPSRPNPPENVLAEPGDDRGDVTVTWDPPTEGEDRAPVDRYRVDQREVSQEKWIQVADTNETTATAADLTEATVYEFRVVAINDAHGLSSSENSSSFPQISDLSVANGTPTEPLDLTTEDAKTFVENDVKKLEVTLGWSAPEHTGGSPLESYQIRQGFTDDKQTSTDTVDASSTTATLTVECPDSGNLTFVVSANNTAHDEFGPDSEQIERGCDQLDPPNPPQDLTADPGQDRGAVDLDWSAPVKDDTTATVDEYHVERRLQGSTNWTLIENVGAAATETTDKDLEEATVFEYRVLAHNTTENLTSEPSSITDSIANGTPTAPSKPPIDKQTFFEDDAKHVEVNLSWSPPARTGGSALDTYRVAQDSHDDETTDATFETDHPTTQAIVTLACPDTGQTAWSFNVTASNTAYDDHGPASADTTVVCDAPESPAQPRNVTAAPGGEEGVVDLDWDAPPQGSNTAPVTEYHILRSSDGASAELVANLAADTTQLTDTGLEPGTVYTYDVVAHNHPHDLSSDGASDETVPKGPPSAPRDLTVQDQQTVFEDGELRVEATLDWDVPAHTGGASIQSYQVYEDSSKIRTVAATPTEAGLSLACSGPSLVSVTAENTAFDDESQHSEDVTIECSVPRPTNLEASPGVRAVELDWTGPEDLEYEVLRQAGDAIPDGASCEALTCTKVTDSAATITGLENETTYHFRVRAVGDDTTTELSSDANATTLGAPQNVEAEFEAQPTHAVGGENPPFVFVDWEHPSQLEAGQLGVATYQIERCSLTARTAASGVATDSCETAGTVPGDVTQFEDTGMGPGVYCYQVIPRNSANESGVASSQAEVATEPTEPVPQDCDVFVRHDTAGDTGVPEPGNPSQPAASIQLSYFEEPASVDTSESPPVVRCPSETEPAHTDRLALADGPPSEQPSGPSEDTQCVRVEVMATTAESEIADETLGFGVPGDSPPDTPEGGTPTASLTLAYFHENPTGLADPNTETVCPGEPAAEGTVKIDSPEAPPVPTADARCAELAVEVNLDGEGEPDATQTLAVGLPDTGTGGE